VVSVSKATTDRARQDILGSYPQGL